jgi:hypothetical protein
MKGKNFWTENVEADKPAAWAAELLYTNLIDPKAGTHPIRIYINGHLDAVAGDRIHKLGQKVRNYMKW